MTSAGTATRVRLAEFFDVPAITAIYNEGITDGIATLETRLREIPEMEAWFVNRSPRHPVLAGCQAEQVIAWASLNVFNYRTCYNGVADISIYVARRCRHQGVGGVMMAALVETARHHQYYKLVLSTPAHNTAGFHLYRRFGFQEVGIYHKQGKIGDQWVDMRIMELFLGPEDVDPAALSRSTS